MAANDAGRHQSSVPVCTGHAYHPRGRTGLHGLRAGQFRERADRDGAALVILSTHYIGTRGDLAFERLTALAEPRGIPVIDYNDYVLRQGAKPRTDATWEHDGHWNTAGHRWAAEAPLEYLKQNQEICTMRKSPTSPPPGPSWMTDYESFDRR